MSRPDVRAALHAKGYRPDGKGGLVRPIEEFDNGGVGKQCTAGGNESAGDGYANRQGRARPVVNLSPDWSRDALSITLPLPPKELRPNFRSLTRYAKMRATKAYRALAAMEARIVCGGAPPRWVKATVTIEWSASGVGAPDPDNIVASLKSALDGLQDAGVVANDRGLWPERPTILTKQAWAGVRLTVRGEAEVVR